MAEAKEEWKIPKLTAENHDAWFRRNKVKLKGKRVFYVCEKSLEKHCQLPTPGDLSDAVKELDITDNKTIKVCINVDMRNKYLEDEATAIDLLFRSLSDDNQALIDEYDTAFQFWAYLRKKYTQTDATAANMYMTRIQTFTFDSESTIIGSWEKLKDYRRKLVAADADTNGAYKDSALLLILIRSLPTRFRTTVDTVNAQLNLTVEQKLKFLEEKEVRDQQDANEQALPAFRKAYKYVPPHKRGDKDLLSLSSNSEPGATSGIQCYLCDQPHYMRDCSKLGKARQLLKEYEVEKKQRKKKSLPPKSSKPPPKLEKPKKKTTPAEPTPAEPTPAQPTEQAATEQVEPPTAEEMEPPPAEQMDTSPAEQVELNPEPIERRRGRPRKLTTAPPTTVSRDERVPDLATEESEEPVQSLPEAPRYFTRGSKRKRAGEDTAEDERFRKIIKAMLAQTLIGKVAIVTGSAGGGIGEAIARELSDKGAHVVVNYPWKAEKAYAETVLSSLHTSEIVVEANLSTLEGPRILVEETVKEYSRIDNLINNASVAINKPLEETTLADWDLSTNLNGRGYFLMTQGVLPYLTPKDSRIVNIVSISSNTGPLNQTIYAGTKGMQEAFTRVWAKELPPVYGCTVNSISPGPTQTRVWNTVEEPAKKYLQLLATATPVSKRFGTLEEVAWSVAMLCEPRAIWINGSHLIACGGLYIP
ncbi:Short chain type dehydrogenase [Pyrenophora tritici-repentis]|nr:Short chain type dehydrogenase [Pyrenophora tritici-repentis]